MGDFSTRLAARAAEKRLLDSIDALPEAERAKMMYRQVAIHLDLMFNGQAKGDKREVGYALLVFPFKGTDGACNYVGNGADRANVMAAMRAQLAQFEAMEAAAQETVN